MPWPQGELAVPVGGVTGTSRQYRESLGYQREAFTIAVSASTLVLSRSACGGSGGSGSGMMSV